MPETGSGASCPTGGQRKSLDRLRAALVKHQELDGVAVRRLFGIG